VGIALSILLPALTGISCNQTFDGQGTVTVSLGDQGRSAYSDTWPQAGELVFETVTLTVKDGNTVITEKKFTSGPYSMEVPVGSGYRLEFEGKIDRKKTKPLTFAQSYNGLSAPFSVEASGVTNVKVQLVVNERDIIYLKPSNGGGKPYQARSSDNFDSLGSGHDLTFKPENFPFKFDLDGPGRMLYFSNAKNIAYLDKPKDGGKIDTLITSLYSDKTKVADDIAWDPISNGLYSICKDLAPNKIFRHDIWNKDASLQEDISLPSGIILPTLSVYESRSIAVDLEGKIYLGVVKGVEDKDATTPPSSLIKGEVVDNQLKVDIKFSYQTDEDRRIWDVRVIKGNVYIITSNTDDDGQLIIADAGTGEKIGSIDSFSESHGDDISYNNPQYIAGWSGGKMYIVTNYGDAAVRVFEIDISDPKTPQILRSSDT
jgi:hypothetical protein